MPTDLRPSSDILQWPHGANRGGGRRANYSRRPRSSPGLRRRIFRLHLEVDLADLGRGRIANDPILHPRRVRIPRCARQRRIAGHAHPRIVPQVHHQRRIGNAAVRTGREVVGDHPLVEFVMGLLALLATSLSSFCSPPCSPIRKMFLKPLTIMLSTIASLAAAKIPRLCEQIHSQSGRTRR